MVSGGVALLVKDLIFSDLNKLASTQDFANGARFNQLEQLVPAEQKVLINLHTWLFHA